MINLSCDKYTLRELGRACKQWRQEHGFTQSDIAEDTGYSIENISSFECGRNDNVRILLWYLLHGLTVEDAINAFLIKRRVNNGADL